MMGRKTTTTKTKKEVQSALLPKLRFPEFREAEGWDVVTLGEVADFVNEKVPLDKVALENYVSTENLLPDYGGVVKASKLPNTGSVTSYRPDDTLVSNIRPYLKKVWVADKAGGTSNDVIVIRAKKGMQPEYLSCLLRNDTFINHVMSGVKGVKMPRGDVGSMKAFPTFYPSKAEQQKIAACLTSVGELIAAQARKVESLKVHKKGLMQQLLPREGETQPRVRFPEFRKAGEWAEQLFHEIFEFRSTNTYSRDQLNYESGSVKNIHYGDIHTKFSTSFHIEKEKVPFINPSVSLSTIKFDAFCQEGDMIFADASEDLTDVAKSIELVSLNSEKVVAGSHTILARPKIGMLVIGFAGYLFKGRSVRAQIEKAAQGAKVLQISPGRLARIKFTLPKNKAEQRRIASCLSILDALITAEGRKLETLKTHKKGLMQQLFPSTNSDYFEAS